jgi:DNA-binding NarL/FixJ family response regulator
MTMPEAFEVVQVARTGVADGNVQSAVLVTGPVALKVGHTLHLPAEIADAKPCPLSDRQITAVRLLSEGLLYKEIALRMGVSISTIRTHFHNAYAIIGVTDRAQAVLKCSREGWI